MLCALAAVVALGEGFLARSAFARDELFVPNQATPSITVYTRTASGDTAPVRTLSGENTGMWNLRAVVVDTLHDELVVSNDFEPSITVYSRTASGDTAPLRTLHGPSTLLGNPAGIVVDTLHDS
jgi:hypothetical protein